MRLSPLRASSALTLIIILATLAPTASAQSREASILGGIITAHTDSTEATTADTAPEPGGKSLHRKTSTLQPKRTKESEAVFSLIRTIGSKDKTARPTEDDSDEIIVPIKGRRAALTLSFISGAFAAYDFYNSGAARGTAHADTGLFRAYLRSCGPTTSGYGWRATFHRFHYGIDVAMAVGDTVHAVLSGIVGRVGYQAQGYGHLITISHDEGLETVYAHLLRPLVSPGQYVEAGQPIALSGNSGNSTGPHLHFETRRRGVPFDPLGTESGAEGINDIKRQ